MRNLSRFPSAPVFDCMRFVLIIGKALRFVKPRFPKIFPPEIFPVPSCKRAKNQYDSIY